MLKQAFAICAVLLFTACGAETGQNLKKAANRLLSREPKADTVADTVNYDDLFLDDKLIDQKTVSMDDWEDTLSDGMYWLNLSALESTQSDQIRLSDPDPQHDYFQAVDVEPKLMNLDSILETVFIAPEIKQQIGPSRLLIKILINRDGRPKDYFVVKSPDSRITREVLEKLRHLRAKPAQLQSQPVKCWVNIQYAVI